MTVTHQCLSCGEAYPCPYCHTNSSFVCSTLNADEDRNMCDECLARFNKAYQEFCDQEGVL